MMSRIFRIATGSRVLLASGALVISGIGLFQLGPYVRLQAHSAGAPLPEEQFGYDSNQLVAFLTDLGAGGRSVYFWFQLWDLLNSFLMGGTALLLIAWLLKRIGAAGGIWRWLAAVPLAVVAAELTENLVLLAALRAYPARSGVSALLPALTGIKFLALLLTMLTIGSCGLWFTWSYSSRKLRTRST